LHEAENEIYKSTVIIKDNLVRKCIASVIQHDIVIFYYFRNVRKVSYRCAILNFPFLPLTNGRGLPGIGFKHEMIYEKVI